MSDRYVGTLLEANPQTLADGHLLLGARATIHGADERWPLSAFARNLGNTHYRPLMVYQPLVGPLGLNNTVFSGSTAVRALASEPRTWGVSGTVRFRDHQVKLGLPSRCEGQAILILALTLYSLEFIASLGQRV